MSNDPLIDEVRAIRRQVAAEAGNDVGTLCDRLREVEKQFRSRIGPFAVVPGAGDEELFPEAGAPVADPLIDDVRHRREELARQRRTGS